MRISDWSSDVCSSDLRAARLPRGGARFPRRIALAQASARGRTDVRRLRRTRYRTRMAGDIGSEGMAGLSLAGPCRRAGMDAGPALDLREGMRGGGRSDPARHGPEAGDRKSVV